MRNDAVGIRRLVPGEDKIENVHEAGGPKRGLGQVAPGAAAPGTPRGLLGWLLRDAAPTQAQSDPQKDEEQQSGGEFRKKSAGQRQAKLEDSPARGRAPHLRKLPDGEDPEKRDRNIGDYKRTEGEKGRHARVNREAQQPSPDTSQS